MCYETQLQKNPKHFHYDGSHGNVKYCKIYDVNVYLSMGN